MIWNGLLVTLAQPAGNFNNKEYRGVAYGKPWPLEDLFAPHENQYDQGLICAVNSLIEGRYLGAFSDGIYPPSVIADTALAMRYILRCQDWGIDTRLLLCATDRSWPVMENKAAALLLPHSKVLGYDYAFSSCDFSPLALNEQELIDPALGLLPQQRNEFGLFDVKSEVERYVGRRNMFMAAAGETYIMKNGFRVGSTPLEDNGDFVVWQVHEVEQNILQKAQ